MTTPLQESRPASGGQRDAALRINPGSRVREDAAFIPAGGDEIFVVVYHPPTPPRAGVIICPPILSEQLKLYRTEVLAARAFAAEGFAVIRFHYRGTGHSGGLFEEATVGTMLEDAAIAASALHRETAAPEVVLCGARWGGLIAGLAASVHPGASLILWEPVVEGARFFAERFRASQMSALAGGNAAAGSRLPVELHLTGSADALGDLIPRGLYDSAATRNLAEAATGRGRRVLLMQVGPRPDLRAEFAALRSAFQTGGSAVETAVVAGEGAWSFIDSALASSEALIDHARRWLAQTFPLPAGS